MKKRILYFDCFAGIAGDMTVAALIDLGVDFNDLEEKLKQLPVKGYHLSLSKVLKHGISGLKFDVHLEHNHTHDHHHSDQNNHSHEHGEHHHHHHGEKSEESHGHSHHHGEHHHRNLDDVTKIITESTFSDRVKESALKMFQLVAEAEAKIHDKPLNEIHFHEVGAIDSIVDILATAYCLDQLNVDEIYSSTISVGKGFVKCAHGLMPLPAPATQEILREIPLNQTNIPKELTTPTGAAIIKAMVKDFIKPEGMRIIKTGYGAGTRDLDIPNMVRVSLAEYEADKKGSGSQVVELTTNIDDMSGEIYSHLFDLLFKEGALDVWVEQIMMKKNRPAQKVSVLVKEDRVSAMEEIIFRETSTFGIRRSYWSRVELDRKLREVETPFGMIRVKDGYLDGELIKSSPEYEDCKRAALEHNVSLQSVYDEVRRV